MQFPQTRRLLLALAYLGCIGLVICNILYWRQNAALREELARSRGVHSGVQLEDFSGNDGGRDVKFVYGVPSPYSGTLLLVFSENCSYCRANYANWIRLLEGFPKNKFRILGVNLGPELSQQSSWRSALHKLLPTIVRPDRNTRLTHAFQTTPQTILIDGDGVVAYTWSGTLDNKRLQEIYSQARVLGGD